MALLESIYLGITGIGRAQQMGLLPEFGDIAGNVFADLIPSITDRVVDSVRGDTNHDFEKLLAAALERAVDRVRSKPGEKGVGRFYWRNTQTGELNALRKTALSEIQRPENAEAVKELHQALLWGEKAGVEVAIRRLIAPLVDLNRDEDWPVVEVDVAKEFFATFNDVYKSKEHVKGRIAFELHATRAMHRDIRQIAAANAALASTLDMILPQISVTLEACKKNGGKSPLEYDVHFQRILGRLDELRAGLYRVTAEVAAGRQENREGFTEVVEKLDGLQGNHHLVASNLPAINGRIALRLGKQTLIEAAIAKCEQPPRIMLLHGLGGYGKSTLGLLHATSKAARARYGHRRWILSCEGRSLPELVSSLLVPSPHHDGLEEKERAEVVRRLLQEEPSLILLDNVADDAQWQSFLDTGLLAGANLDVIVTSRELLKRSVCGEVKVERLAPDEVQSLLAARRPAILAPAHAAARATIERETEGMALLVAAVAWILGDPEVDIDAYAASLKAMPLENLPAADEEGLPYPKLAGEILANYHCRLPPAMRRIVEYGTLMLPDLIESKWLEWLIAHDSSGSPEDHHHITLGSNRAGEPRQPSAIVREAIDAGLLRWGKRQYRSGSGECLTLHRIHRKEASRRMTIDRWTTCWRSLSALLLWITGSVPCGHEEREEMVSGLGENERRSFYWSLIDSVDELAAGVSRAILDSFVAHAEPALRSPQSLLKMQFKQSEDIVAAEVLICDVIDRITNVAENLWEWSGFGCSRLSLPLGPQCTLVEERIWWELGFELSWLHLCRVHMRASLSRPGEAEADYLKARALVDENLGSCVDWKYVPVGYVISAAVACAYLGKWRCENGAYELATDYYGEAIRLGEKIRFRLTSKGEWRRCYRDGLSQWYRERSAALRALGVTNKADEDERQAVAVESSGDWG